MSRIRVVTDSATLFINPSIARRYDIAIVPVYVRFGDERFQLGVELGPEEFLHRLQYDKHHPVLEAPRPEEIHATYARLNRDVNQIVSIHISAQLSDVYRNAIAASKMLLGRCDIAVIDSQTLSAGVGMLVEHAAQLTKQTNSLEEIVRAVRKAIACIYTVFYVETMDTICRHGLISKAQTILGSMLDIMPFITIEEGRLVIMEKALSRPQAVDKLVEFASEFTALEQLAILHHSSTLSNSVRTLQDRLALELSVSNFPTLLYDGAVGTYLGPDAVGIVIFEGQEDEML